VNFLDIWCSKTSIDDHITGAAGRKQTSPEKNHDSAKNGFLRDLQYFHRHFLNNSLPSQIKPAIH